MKQPVPANSHLLHLVKWLGLSAILVLVLLSLTRAVQFNGQNLQVVHQVVRPQKDVLGLLELRKPTTITSSLWQETGQGCATIWQSRLWASYDVTRAKQFLADAQECKQLPENQLIWQGNLLWITNKPEDALVFWEQLPDPTLLSYARTVLLSGEQSAGLALIGILEQRAVGKSIIVTNGPFFAALAELYRYAGQEMDGLTYHLLAWQSGQRGYEQAYYLGRGLAQIGRCAEAVEVFTIGNSQKPDMLVPLLDFSYYVTWGSCYASLGQVAQAQAVYNQARTILENTQTTLSPETFQQQMAWLTGLEQQLQK